MILDKKHKTDLNFLLLKNKEYANKYRKSSLMNLICSDEMSKKEIRDILLDCIQVFSNYFQKTVMLRYLLCEHAKFLETTQEHLKEEFAHNLSLDADRNYRPLKWDPILDATAGWFTWKMFTLDNEEKLVLVHLVLETSANIFFQEAHRVMLSYGETNYFQIHSELDERHENLGRELLENLTPFKYERLVEIQCQGWGMLNTVCDRITKLTTSKI